MEGNLNELMATLQTLVVEYGMKILGAIALLVIGWWIIGRIMRLVTRAVDSRGIDKTLKPVIVSICSVLLKVMLLLAVAASLGVKTASFVAILGAAGLAAGLALQGSLSNLAGGFLLLLFRPLEVGDYIKAQGEEGFVKAIELFTTTLETPDHTTIYLPNGALANGNIVNVSRLGTVRLHLAVGIGYGEDIRKAREVLVKVMKNEPMVLQTPEPTVAVVNLGDSSVDLDLRPYCKAGDAPAVTVTILEKAKIALDESGIEIPFPQTAMHIKA